MESKGGGGEERGRRGEGEKRGGGEEGMGRRGEGGEEGTGRRGEGGGEEERGRGGGAVAQSKWTPQSTLSSTVGHHSHVYTVRKIGEALSRV